MKSEARILADVYTKVRGLSKAFISKCGDIDITKQMEIDGIKFNSAQWILAHLCWTENFLIINGVANEDMNIPWLEEFGYGTDPSKVKTKPPFEELTKTMDTIHEKALKIISEMTDEQLDEENHINASFGGAKSKRNVIMHAIRHEPMHIGQLSWIYKMNGMKFA